MLETDDKVVRVANHDAMPSRMVFAPPVDPEIEHVVEKDVG